MGKWNQKAQHLRKSLKSWPRNARGWQGIQQYVTSLNASTSWRQNTKIPLCFQSGTRWPATGIVIFLIKCGTSETMFVTYLLAIIWSTWSAHEKSRMRVLVLSANRLSTLLCLKEQNSIIDACGHTGKEQTEGSEPLSFQHGSARLLFMPKVLRGTSAGLRQIWN